MGQPLGIVEHEVGGDTEEVEDRLAEVGGRHGVGAGSAANRSVDPWTVPPGIPAPARRIQAATARH